MANDPQGFPRRQTEWPSPECPHCETHGQPFEVEEGRGYRRIAYRCGECHYTWVQTIALAPETVLR
jgi:transposase-like protein